jgi:hypothetical protein
VQKGPIDQLDKNAAVLHGLDRIGDLEQLAGGFFWIGIGPVSGEFHRVVGSEFRGAPLTDITIRVASRQR